MDIEEATAPARSVPYEAMCRSLYEYRVGAISFLDLLQRFEEALGLPMPPRSDRLRPVEKE